MAHSFRLLELPYEIRTSIYTYLVPKMLTVEPIYNDEDDLVGLQAEAKEPVFELPLGWPCDPEDIVWERRCGASMNDVISLRLTSKLAKLDIDDFVGRELWVMLQLDGTQPVARELFPQGARADITHLSMTWLGLYGRTHIDAKLVPLQELLHPESATFPKLQQIDLLFHGNTPDLDYLIGLKRLTTASETMKCVYSLGDYAAPSMDCAVFFLVQEGTDVTKIKQTDLRGELSMSHEAGLVELDIDTEIRQPMQSSRSYHEFAKHHRESDDEWLYDVIGSLDPAAIYAIDPMRGGLDPDGRLFTDMVDL
ncbi:uncharacterized protein AB675_5164 [Cyphellophora attinorum]|uniref:Uncharacterized protein n=1 Tax=Cyphellophora attinorum TaxID=1664694 RepID=A0A0N0NLN4_9EURO|nr:uncharacterized protein AB675_5164 [Phialophora attinorum]KPI39239.1 hypothetical protein AB675_5164 [Phialophora attinorum]